MNGCISYLATKKPFNAPNSIQAIIAATIGIHKDTCGRSGKNLFAYVAVCIMEAEITAASPTIRPALRSVPAINSAKQIPSAIMSLVDD